MKKQLTKLIALVMMLTIAVINPTTAFAYFGPSNNQVGASNFTGEVIVSSDITSNAGNKLIITMPEADLSTASGGELTDGANPLLVDTVDVDNVAKTVTYTFLDALHAGKMLVFSINNVVSTAGNHPYTIEIHAGETSTTTELENGNYTINDNGLTVNLNVQPFLNFGLTTDTLNLDLNYNGPRAVNQRDIAWNVATNAQEYSVSAKLKTEFTSGSHQFPYSIPAEMGDYISDENMQYVTGVFVGHFAPGHPRGNNMLINQYTPIKTAESVLLTNGQSTNGDNDSTRLVFAADAKIPVGLFSAIIEFTVTATF